MTWNIAHRGGAGQWPENTLLAFENSARAGYDGAELDVQLTADGTCVVFHDRDVRAGPPITAVRDRDLRGINVGTREQPQHIPTLHETIAAVQRLAPAFKLLIELKLYPTSPTPDLGEALAAAAVSAVREAHFDANAVFVGFDWTAVAQAKRLAPDIPAWFTSPPFYGDAGRIIDAVVSAGAQGWFAHLTDAREEQAHAARAEGLVFGVWTVNRDTDLRTCLNLGADAICTDYPDRLHRLAAQRPSNSAVDR